MFVLFIRPYHKFLHNPHSRKPWLVEKSAYMSKRFFDIFLLLSKSFPPRIILPLPSFCQNCKNFYYSVKKFPPRIVLLCFISTPITPQVPSFSQNSESFHRNAIVPRRKWITRTMSEVNLAITLCIDEVHAKNLLLSFPQVILIDTECFVPAERTQQVVHPGQILGPAKTLPLLAQ